MGEQRTAEPVESTQNTSQLTQTSLSACCVLPQGFHVLRLLGEQMYLQQCSSSCTTEVSVMCMYECIVCTLHQCSSSSTTTDVSVMCM